MTREEIDEFNRIQSRKLREWCKGKPVTVSKTNKKEENQNNGEVSKKE